MSRPHLACRYREDRLNSQVTVVPSQYRVIGTSVRQVHAIRRPGSSWSTRICSFGPPKPKRATEPTLGSAVLSVVQNDASPVVVEIASKIVSAGALMPTASTIGAAIADSSCTVGLT